LKYLNTLAMLRYLLLLLAFCYFTLHVQAQKPDSTVLKVAITGVNATCFNSDDAAISIVILEGVTPAVLQWQNTDLAISGAEIIDGSVGIFHLNALRPGNYKIYLANGFGADTSINVVLTAPPQIIYKLNFEGEKCYGKSSGWIELSDFMGGIPPYSVLVGDQTAPNNRWENLHYGSYFVEIEDAAGCLVKEAVVLPSGLEFDFEMGDSLHLFSGDTISGTFVTGRVLQDISWTPSNCCQFHVNGSYQIFPKKDTDINIVVTDTNGCKSEDNWGIIVHRKRSIYAPNVFTPTSGTPENQLFSLFSAGGIKEIKWLRIGDQTGRLWYNAQHIATDNPSNGWDGTASGKQAPVGVYFWVAEVVYTDGRTEVIQGDVTLVR
jgi:hypothetical protein